MDQSKWRIPRYHGPNGQRPLKSTMNLQRPQLKVQGIWIFNVLLDLYASKLQSSNPLAIAGVDRAQMYNVVSLTYCLTQVLSFQGHGA